MCLEEVVRGSFPKELDLDRQPGVVKKTEMRKKETQARTQWVKVQAVEEAPGGHK